MQRLKIGLFGVGHLGKIHLKCILALPEYDCIGFYDPNPENAALVSQEYGAKAFDDADQLLDLVDVVDIVTPTIHHFALAQKAMEMGKHVFIEKPVTETVDEAKILLEIQKRKGNKVQVGHVERYNPAFLSLKKYLKDPVFIEAHRLSQFNPRGTDVSVVHDLMIHDLDLISTMVQSEVKEIRASGVPIVSKTHDICNARIEFEDGCVCNITASRLSVKQMRKIRIFQRDGYFSLDMLKKEAQIIRLDETPPDDNYIELETYQGKRYISMVQAEIQPLNAIQEELSSFHRSIVTDQNTEVSLQDGYKALRLVHDIMNEINA